MFKKSICTAMASLVLTMTTGQAFANVSIVPVVQVEQVQSQSLLSIINEFDDMLSNGEIKSPEAAQSQMVTRLNQAVQNSSSEQIKSQLEEIYAQIPSEEKRTALKSKLKYASEEELVAMITNPVVLKQVLQGQGSNFVYITGSDVVDALLVIGLVAIIVAAIKYDMEHESYYSYSEDYVSYSENHYCSASRLEGYLKDDMIDDAMIKCRKNATNPDTCKHKGYDVKEYEDRDYDGDFIKKACIVKARVEAKE